MKTSKWWLVLGMVLVLLGGCGLNPASDSSEEVYDLEKATVVVELSTGNVSGGGSGISPSVIEVEELLIMGATIALSNSLGWGEVKSWTRGDPMVFTFQVPRKGIYTLTVTDWDTAGHTNVATAVIHVAAGSNYRIRVTLGGVIYIEGEDLSGLTFYSSFDDLGSTLSPLVGPRGYATTTNLSFVAGKFGNAYYAPYNVDFGIVYSNFVLPSTEGCIEFWAKLVNPPVNIPVGDAPVFVRIGEGNYEYRVLFNANDGVGGSGLCGNVHASGDGLAMVTLATGGSRYSDILSSGVTNWNHYALVWRSDGFEDGRRARLYLNGQVVSPSSYRDTLGPADIPGFTNAVIQILQNVNSSGGVIIDELRIWSYAKTNFSL
ncbi:LamG-like jellyroll fold domain-containing protein [Thermospira aquatica]|uniref:LamG domain-containing protein n=1 Tax=Thermospira aquatica TaxID=2828656 RepID=A0AAX3BDI0_9SPIR|nr:LamG-like jellyroll fold domain-containing protein [Thermospira aquatica]URA10309.1 hypothetical protein KDW03_00445 [Thermospira aquatica]